MPLQWLGALEDRPSPLSQAMTALEPAAVSIANWLAQAPEREKKLVDEFLMRFYDATEEDQQLMLNAPGMPRMAQLIERQYPGTVIRDEATGKVQIIEPIDVQRKRMEWKETQAAQLLTPIWGMDEQQREQFINTPEGQERMQRVKQLAPHWVMGETGALRPITNIDQELDRVIKRATAGEIGARTEVAKATAEQIVTNTDLLREDLAFARETHGTRVKLVERNLDEIDLNLDYLSKHNNLALQYLQAQIADLQSVTKSRDKMSDAQLSYLIEQTNVLKETAKEIAASTKLKEENLQQLKDQAPWLVKNLEADYQRKMQEIAQSDLEFPEKLKQMRTITANYAEQTKKMQQEREQGEKLFSETLAQARLTTQTMEENYNFLKETHPIEAEKLRAQVNTIVKTLELAVEKQPYELLGLYAQAQKWLADTDQVRQMTPHMINNLIKEGELLEQEIKERVAMLPYKVDQAAAEVEYRKMLTDTGYRAQALAEVVARHNIDVEDMRLLLDQQQQAFEQDMAKQAFAYQKYADQMRWDREDKQFEANFALSLRDMKLREAAQQMEDWYKKRIVAIEEVKAKSQSARDKAELALAEKELNFKITTGMTQLALEQVTSLALPGGIPTDPQRLNALMDTTHKLAKTYVEMAGGKWDEDAFIAAFGTRPEIPTVETPTIATEKYKKSAQQWGLNLSKWIGTLVGAATPVTTNLMKLWPVDWTRYLERMGGNK